LSDTFPSNFSWLNLMAMMSFFIPSWPACMSLTLVLILSWLVFIFPSVSSSFPVGQRSTYSASLWFIVVPDPCILLLTQFVM
jgi:hypothetical protein